MARAGARGGGPGAALKTHIGRISNRQFFQGPPRSPWTGSTNTGRGHGRGAWSLEINQYFLLWKSARLLVLVQYLEYRETIDRRHRSVLARAALPLAAAEPGAQRQRNGACTERTDAACTIDPLYAGDCARQTHVRTSFRTFIIQGQAQRQKCLSPPAAHAGIAGTWA